MYEVAGTAGAFSSAAVIKKLGNNYSFCITPPCFALAGIIWFFVSSNFDDKKAVADELGAEGLGGEETSTNYFVSLAHGAKNFGQAVYLGAKITLTSRKFCWLVPGYAFALVGHRYLENNLANIFAKQILKDSSYQQIIIGGTRLRLSHYGQQTQLTIDAQVPTSVNFWVP